MKRSTFLALLAAAPLAFTIVACQHDPGTSVQPDAQPLFSRTVPNANPVFTFTSSRDVSRTTYPTLAVMDVDATDLTHLYTGPFGAVISSASWNQTGSGTSSSPWKVSFQQRNGNAYDLKTMNVWVTSGVAYGSTPASIQSFSSTSSMEIKGQQWSPVASEIAYTTYDISSSSVANRTAEIRVVSSTGGTPTTLYSETGVLQFGSPSWSPDGSKIAFSVITPNSSGVNTYAIKIIDRADPTSGSRVATTVISTTDRVTGPQWSQTSGVNLIGYKKIVTDASGDHGQLYTIAPTANATPQAVTAGSSNVYGGSFCWSPDDSQIAYDDSYDGLSKILTRSTGAIGSLGTSQGPGHWRK